MVMPRGFLVMRLRAACAAFMLAACVAWASEPPETKGKEAAQPKPLTAEQESRFERSLEVEREGP